MLHVVDISYSIYVADSDHCFAYSLENTIQKHVLQPYYHAVW